MTITSRQMEIERTSFSTYVLRDFNNFSILHTQYKSVTTAGHIIQTKISTEIGKPHIISLLKRWTVIK